MTVLFNEKNGRYEMTIDGHIVFCDVRRDGKTVYLDHVEAPKELRGTGAAGKFMQAMMETIRAEGARAIPVCGYAAAWLAKHPEFSGITGDAPPPSCRI